MRNENSLPEHHLAEVPRGTDKSGKTQVKANLVSVWRSKNHNLALSEPKKVHFPFYAQSICHGIRNGGPVDDTSQEDYKHKVGVALNTEGFMVPKRNSLRRSP